VGPYKALFFFLVLSCHAWSDITLGVCPSETTILRSKEKQAIFSKYLEKQLGQPIHIAQANESGALLHFLLSGKIQVALLPNTVYRVNHKKLDLLVNFSRSKSSSTHQLLLLTAKNSGITKADEFSDWKTSLAVDRNTPSRTFWLTSVLHTPPEEIFSHISTVNRVPEALNGVLNGTYGAACVESDVLEAMKRFDPGLIKQLKIVARSPAFASDPLVIAKNIQAGWVEKLSEVLVHMNLDSNGQQVLLGLKITRFIKPVSSLNLYPEPPVHRKTKEKAEVTKTTNAPTVTLPKEEKPPAIIAAPRQSDVQTKPEQEIPASLPPPTAVQQQDTEKKPEISSAPVPEKEVQKKALIVPPEVDMNLVENTQDHTSGSLNPVWWFGLPLVLVIFLGILFLKSKSRQQKPGNSGSKEKKAPASTTVQPPGDMASQFSGDLKTFCFPELLQLLASSRETGELSLKTESRTIIIRFHEGQLCTARMEPVDPRYQLGPLLVRLHKITRNHCRTAENYAIMNPDLKFGQCLLKQRVISMEGIREGLKYQAQEIIFNAFLLKTGQFELTRKQVNYLADEEPLIKIVGLIMEGTQRQQSWDHLLGCLPEKSFRDLFFQITKDLDIDKVELTPVEKGFINLFDGQKSLSQVFHDSGYFDYEAGHLVCRLMQMGYLTPSS